MGRSLLGGHVDLGVELVLLGAECQDERAFAGSIGAAAGAQRFWRTVSATLADAGPGRCRVTTVHPEADANAALAALQQAAAREGRLLLVYLAGQLVWDQRRRRPAVVVAGSLRESAARRGLSFDWVTSAMSQGAAPESLLVLDLAAEPEAWHEWPEWVRAGPAGPLGGSAAGVSLWGRVARFDAPRRGRTASSGGAGTLAESLGALLEAGLAGAPAVLDPATLHPALVALGRDESAVHWVDPPDGCRLLLRNRAALRGLLRGGPGRRSTGYGF